MTGDPASGGQLDPGDTARVPQQWDAGRELDVDRRAERRLLTRELLVLAVIAGLVLLRILFVHGS